MPLYTFSCSQCRKRFDLFRKMADYQQPAGCPTCNTPAQRVITPVAVLGDFPAYECPVTGKVIEGRRAHEENLKRTGCRISEPGEKDEFLRRKVAEEVAFDSAIEDEVGRVVEALPVESKMQLAKELSTGAETSVVRS
jgi:putative FmdB family regulatory protein